MNTNIKIYLLKNGVFISENNSTSIFYQFITHLRFNLILILQSRKTRKFIDMKHPGIKPKINIVFISISLIALALSLGSGKNKTFRIFMAGDSTMADKPLFKAVVDSASGDTIQEPWLERGWGQLLPEFVDKNTEVHNYALNGRSTKTFREEGVWTKLENELQRGDVVIIQFGHNDASLSKGKRYASPEEYRNNLLFFIHQAWEKGANPILCTSVARRKYIDGKLVHSHGVYPYITKSVAKETGVPMIDMEALTYEWLEKTGSKKNASFFHKYAPGVSRLFPKGLDDNTHFNEKGARTAAKFFVQEVKAQKIEILSKHLK